MRIDKPRIETKQIITDEEIAKAISDAKLIEEFLETPVWKTIFLPHLEGKINESIELLIKKESERLRGDIQALRGFKKYIEKTVFTERDRAIKELEQKEKREKRR